MIEFTFETFIICLHKDLSIIGYFRTEVQLKSCSRSWKEAMSLNSDRDGWWHAYSTQWLSKISILPIKFSSPKIVNFLARELIFCAKGYFFESWKSHNTLNLPLNENVPIMTFLLLKSDHVMAWDCMVGTCANHLFSVSKSIWKGYLVSFFLLKARICH